MGFKVIISFLLSLYIICTHANVQAPEHMINDANPTLPMSKEKLADLVSQNRKLIYSEPMLSVLNSTNVQSVLWECRSDFRTLALDYILPGDLPNPYAVRMVDSFGKPEAGLEDGNYAWFGSFQECESATDYLRPWNDNVDFTSEYCTMVMGLVVGFCVPSSCGESDIKTLMNEFYLNLLNESNVVTEVFCADPIPWRVGDTVMVVFTALFGVLVILSTGYELHLKWKKQKATQNGIFKSVDTPTPATVQLNKISTISVDQLENNGKVPSQGGEVYEPQSATGSTNILVQPNLHQVRPSDETLGRKEKLLQSFSISSNTSKLVDMTSTPKGMESLNGMRVLSMAWVILGHTYIFFGSFSKNSEVLYGYVQSLSFQFVAEAEVAVDTFFFLSGFLVAFGTLKLLHKNKGRLNWAMFYIHRYLRLTPVYAFVLFFYMSLLLHFVTGPMESYDTQNLLFPFHYCYKYWWSNLLYINTLYPYDISQTCMAWTWYLSHDMIYYVLSPIFVYTLYKSRPAGYILILFGLVSNMITLGVVHDKAKISEPFATHPDKEKYSFEIYYKPYARYAPYLVGIACADFYMWTKDRARNMKATWWKVFVVFMWAVAVALNLAILYGIHPYYQDNFGIIEPVWLNNLYSATFRTAWGLILAWISYACLTGWGGFINTILSLKIWEPLVRLCYLAYLLHPIVIITFQMNMQQTLYGNHWIFAYLFVAYLGVTFACSSVLFLLVEQPFNRIERLLLKK